MIKCMFFKEFFVETNDLNLFIEVATTAQSLKAHQDPELVKIIKSMARTALSTVPFFAQPIGKKMLDRYVNFFSYQLLQDPDWIKTSNLMYSTIKPTQNAEEIKSQYASMHRVDSRIKTMWEYRKDYFVAMGDRIASKLNNPAYTTAVVDQEVADWHAELAARERGLPDQEAKTFLKLDHLGKKWKGWKWVDLDRGYCSQEAEAMGHCGNVGQIEGDNIVSLRDADGYAHLTFIINDGFLGEAKGRANDKPSQKYHAPIVELLKSKHIESITGGGYAPENNFKFDDLHDDHKKELEHKPHMDDPVGHVAEKYKDDPKNMVGKMNEFFGTVFEDFDGNNFVAETFKGHNRSSRNQRGQAFDKWIGPYTEIEEISKNWEHGPVRVGWMDDDDHDHDQEGYHGLDTSELVSKLNAENLAKIKEIINASRDDLEGGIDEYDLEELVDEDDAITQALGWAAGDAQNSGNQAEAYNSVHRQLGEEDENGFWIDFNNHPYQLKISLENVKALHKEMENDGTLDQEDIGPYITLQYSEPQGGHYGDFDDGHYNELVSDHLHDIPV